MNICPNCGESLNGTRYCTRCGCDTIGFKPYRCPNCGNEMGSSRFCTVCGYDRDSKVGNTNKNGSYLDDGFVILALIWVFPVGLFLMWYFKKFKKSSRIVITVVITLLCLLVSLSFLGCNHTWSEATCAGQPSTCIECGDVRDSVIPPHDWVEATCTEAQYCNECGKIEGEALGHAWEEGYCVICGEVDSLGF